MKTSTLIKLGIIESVGFLLYIGILALIASLFVMDLGISEKTTKEAFECCLWLLPTIGILALFYLGRCTRWKEEIEKDTASDTEETLIST